MGRVADAMKERGYRALPRWWVTQEQFEMIEWMAKQNASAVNRIRHEALGTLDEAAWKQHMETRE